MIDCYRLNRFQSFFLIFVCETEHHSFNLMIENLTGVIFYFFFYRYDLCLCLWFMFWFMFLFDLSRLVKYPVMGLI